MIWKLLRDLNLRAVYCAVLPACALALTPAAPATAYEVVSIKATRPLGASHLKGELFKPKGDGPFPAVVLMHGCGGWQPAVLGGLHAHASTLVEAGYVVLNLDSFGPRGTGGGVICESIPKLVRALDYRTDDAFDALRYLRTLNYVEADDIFLMGQSNGGSVAINAAKAKRRGYRAVAAYYPWCGSLGGAKVKLTAPLIVFAGQRDDWVPAWQCRHKRGVGASLQVIEYRNAAHSFDLPIMQQRYLGKLIGYDKTATEDSRAQMVAFFERHRTHKPVAPEALQAMASVSEPKQTTPGVSEPNLTMASADEPFVPFLAE